MKIFSLEIKFKNYLVVYKLRKYLRKLYEGYPTHAFYGYEKKEEIEKGIRVLQEDGIIKYVQDEDNKKCYRLTAEGLKLVESWNVILLTIFVIILTIFDILLIFYQLNEKSLVIQGLIVSLAIIFWIIVIMAYFYRYWEIRKIK